MGELTDIEKKGRPEIEWPEKFEDVEKLDELQLHPLLMEKLDELARAKIIVSFAYGQCGNHGIMFSVDMVHHLGLPTGKPPFACRTFPQAVWIAYREAKKLKWID